MPNAKRQPVKYEQTEKTYNKIPTIRKIKRDTRQRTEPTHLHLYHI